MTLRGLISRITPVPAASFPILCDSLVLFALLTDGQGPHVFQLRVVALSSADEESSIRVTAPVRINLGRDPLALRGLPIPLFNLPLEHPGGIEFRLYCDDRPIATEYVSVEDGW